LQRKVQKVIAPAPPPYYAVTGKRMTDALRHLLFSAAMLAVLVAVIAAAAAK
jgi:hypothetical protein